MNALEALILGIIQGLTEFLPVSSSGHIEIGKVLLGIDNPEDAGLVFTVLLHIATALSTVVVFRKDIVDILSGLIKRDQESLKFVFFIVVSMIPAVLVGLLLNDQIEALFDGNLMLVGSALIFTAAFLFISDRFSNTSGKVNFLKSIFIGLAQAIAILPGISRSGATIATAVILNIDREKAARFSFLMVLPLIFGKMAKDILDAAKAIDVIAFELNYVVGFAAAFVTGIFACNWMITLVKKSSLSYFAIYCLIVGIISIASSII